MKKHLNVDMIQSELRGGSAFFPGYKGRQSPAPSAAPPAALKALHPPTMDLVRTTPAVPAPKPGVKKPDKPDEALDKMEGVPPPVPRTGPRTEPLNDQLVPRVKRAMKQRQPFDIYDDQYVRLRRIADSERGFVNGRGMSQMVREAIDTYLAAHFSQSKK